MSMNIFIQKTASPPAPRRAKAQRSSRRDSRDAPDRGGRRAARPDFLRDTVRGGARGSHARPCAHPTIHKSINMFNTLTRFFITNSCRGPHRVRSGSGPRARARARARPLARRRHAATGWLGAVGQHARVAAQAAEARGERELLVGAAELVVAGDLHAVMQQHRLTVWRVRVKVKVGVRRGEGQGEGYRQGQGKGQG